MQNRRGSALGEQPRQPEVPPETALPRGRAPDASPASLATSETTGTESLDQVCLTAFAPASLSRAAPAPGGGRGSEKQPGFTPESP